MLTLNQALRIEEFKLVKARLETHEKRYYELLLYASTGMIAIFGLSDRIPTLALPLMLGLLLVVTGELATQSKIHQNYASAYLYVMFDKSTPSLNFEAAYFAIFKVHTYKRERAKLQRLIGACRAPFGLLAATSLLFSAMFASSFLTEQSGEGFAWRQGAYVAAVLAMHGQVLRSVARYRLESATYYCEHMHRWIIGLAPTILEHTAFQEARAK